MMHLEPEALSLLAADPRGAILIPLYKRLGRLLPTRTISERVHILGRYLDLLDAAPTWTEELPHADEAADIERIFDILADPAHQFLTSQIDPGQIDDKFHAWKTIRSIPDLLDDAVTGLTAMMLILDYRGEPKTARRLSSAIRGRAKRRALTKDEERAENDGSLMVERVGDILESLPLAPSPGAQLGVLLDELERIRRAKPNFSKIIFQDLPKYFSVPEAESSDVNLCRFPLNKTSHEADGPDEELGDETHTYYSDQIDRRHAPLSVQRAFHQQAIWSSNPLLLEGHVTALTEIEALSFAGWLREQTEPEKFTAERRTSLLLLLLVMTTGRTVQAADDLLRSTLLATWSAGGRIDLHEGQLILPAPMPEGSFQPTSEEADHLLNTSDEFALSLPPPLLDSLRAWATSGSTLVGKRHHEQVNDLLGEYRKVSSKDISLGRIRQYLATRLMTIGHDPAIVQWVTGNSHGQSTGYLHYAHVQATDLANAYTRAVWPLFDQNARLSTQPVGAVGSRAVPKEGCIAQCVKKLSHRFNTSKYSPGHPASLAGRHNLMATYVTSMLTAVTGHRISGALLELRRGDFLLSFDGKDWLGVATFSDKRQDDAHYYRPVPLGQSVAEQIGLYLLHLETLRSEMENLPQTGSGLEAVCGALDGSGPLFFWLNPDLSDMPADFNRWHEAFKSSFPHFPSNFGRHFLAHKFRSIHPCASDLKSSPETLGGGELACLVLGHFPVIGDPYGKDSPTDIKSMAATLGSTVDEIYTSQAWLRRGGLVKPPRRFQPHHIQPPELTLKSWAPERQALEQELKARQATINQKRKKSFDEEKDDAKDAFFAALHEVHPKLARALTEEPVPKLTEPMSLSRQDLTKILAGPDGSEGQRGKATWAKLRVARTILGAAKRRNLYQGPLPAKTHHLSQGDQTPLLQGMYRAYETLLHLRKVYPEILAKDFEQTDHQTADRLYGHLAIASILYGSVWQLPVLEGLLRCFGGYRRSPALPDSVLVELDIHPPTTWALWGLPALLVARFAQIETLETPPDPDRLSLTIWQILPSSIRPEDRTQTLNHLLDTASVVCRIELSGGARLSLSTDPDTCSWSLPLDRQIPLLEGTEDPRTAVPYTPPQRRGRQRKGQRTSEWYKWLLAVIPVDSTKAADSTEQLRKVETNRRHRQPAVAKIKAALKTEPLTEIEQALGYWLVQLLYSRKGSGPELFAHKTVKTYLTSIAPGLLEQIADRTLADIEDDAWADIYASVLNGYQEGTLNSKLLQIQRLHKLMERQFSVRPLPDECLPVKDQVESKVRNSLALPVELNLVLNEYHKAVTDRNAKPHGEREVLQACIALMLLVATGSRIGEVAGLQHRDIMIMDKGIVLVRIRINAFRRIKSRAAARVIPITLNEQQTQIIKRFMEAEEKRLGETHYRPTRLLFVDLSQVSRGLPQGTDTLRPYIGDSLRQASPVYLISYDIRHLRGTSLQVDMALGAEAIPGPATTAETITLPKPQPNLLRLPRWTFSRAMVMGHARPRTTNHSYGGLPWLYLAPNAHSQSDYLTHDAAVSLLGIITAGSARSMTRHAGNETGWLLDRLVPRSTRKASSGATSRTVNLDQLRRENIPDSLIYLLYALGKSEEEAYPSYGLSEKDYKLIRQTAKTIAAETRYVFLHSLAHGQEQGKAEGAPRWYSGSEALLAIATEMTNPSSPIWDIAASYRQIMTPLQKQTDVVLDIDSAERLKELLKQPLDIDTTRYGSKMLVSITMGARRLDKHLGWLLSAIEVLRPLFHPPPSND